MRNKNVAFLMVDVPDLSVEGGANELFNPENGILIPLEYKDNALLKSHAGDDL